MSVLKLDQLNLLDINTKSKKAKRILEEFISDAKSEYEQFSIEIGKERVKEAEKNNPNYIHHKLYDTDISQVITNMIRIAASQNNTYTNKTIKLAWDQLVAKTGKHPDWLAKVKHRQTTGWLIPRAIGQLKLGGAPDIASTLKPIEISPLITNSTCNKALKSLQEQLEIPLMFAKLEQDLAKKQNDNLKLILRVEELELENKKLKQGVITESKGVWKSKAIHLRAKGVLVKNICKTVGKRKTVVSTHLNTPDSKAKIEQIKSKPI